MSRNRRLLLAGVSLIALIAGCSSSSGSSDAAASASRIAEATTRPAPVDSTFPGIGATRADWDATHDRSILGPEGTAYGGAVRDQHPTYQGVAELNQRIGLYSLNLPLGTSEEVALVAIRNELPAGAIVREPVDQGMCSTVMVESDALSGALSAGGVAAAMFTSLEEGSDFDPSDVRVVMFGPTASAKVPGC